MATSLWSGRRSEYELSLEALRRAQARLLQARTVASARKIVDEIELCLLGVRRALWNIRRANKTAAKSTHLSHSIRIELPNQAVRAGPLIFTFRRF